MDKHTSIFVQCFIDEEKRFITLTPEEKASLRRTGLMSETVYKKVLLLVLIGF
jgi:hypothetical protein